MENTIKKLIATADYEGLKQILSQHPNFANEEIAYDEVNTAKAHPLHRICDGGRNVIKLLFNGNDSLLK